MSLFGFLFDCALLFLFGGVIGFCVGFVACAKMKEAKP